MEPAVGRHRRDIGAPAPRAMALVDREVAFRIIPLGASVFRIVVDLRDRSDRPSRFALEVSVRARQRVVAADIDSRRRCGSSPASSAPMYRRFTSFGVFDELQIEGVPSDVVTRPVVEIGALAVEVPDSRATRRPRARVPRAAKLPARRRPHTQSRTAISAASRSVMLTPGTIASRTAGDSCRRCVEPVEHLLNRRRRCRPAVPRRDSR